MVSGLRSGTTTRSSPSRIAGVPGLVSSRSWCRSPCRRAAAWADLLRRMDRRDRLHHVARSRERSKGGCSRRPVGVRRRRVAGARPIAGRWSSARGWADRALPVGPRRRHRPLRDHAQGGGAARARSGPQQAERRDGDPTVGVDRSRAGDDARHQRRQRDVLSGALPAAVRVRRVPAAGGTAWAASAGATSSRASGSVRATGSLAESRTARGAGAIRLPRVLREPVPSIGVRPAPPADRSHEGRTVTPHASSNHARLSAEAATIVDTRTRRGVSSCPVSAARRRDAAPLRATAMAGAVGQPDPERAGRRPR